MNPYPPDLILTVDDFNGCGWKKALSDANDPDRYNEIRSALWEAEKEAREEGRKEHGKALWLLASSCFMMLVPDNANEPYQPIYTSGNERGIIPEDYSESDITFFANIVNLIDNTWLRARIADLVWTVERSKRFPFALIAIDSYMELPLEVETWRHEVRDCWERAVVLAKMLGQGSGDRLRKLHDISVETLMSDDELALDMSRILKDHELYSTDKAEDIANRLERVGDRFQDGAVPTDLYHSEALFKASKNWFNVAENKQKSAGLTVKIAEIWVLIAAGGQHEMVVAAHLEHAIRELQNVPTEFRDQYKVEQRIYGLRKQHNEASKNSLSEMVAVTTPIKDFTGIMQDARDEVKGKEINEALFSFVNLSGINTNRLREEQLREIKEHPLLSMLPASIVNQEGHTVGHRPGIDIGAGESEENKAAIESHMVQKHAFHVELSTHAMILPAHEMLLAEHRLNESFFLSLVHQCPVIPPDREVHFAKGLLDGYNKDYVTAMYILTPQVEHLVRHFLKYNGIDTTKFVPQGQYQSGLGELIYKPESKEILGEDLHFQIRALFCDPSGNNVRNNVAHGLFHDGIYHSSVPIYSWYFVLKIAINTWYRSRQSSDKSEEE